MVKSIVRGFGGIVALCGLLSVESAYGADESISEDALKHFKAGVALLQDPDGARYEDAYREFEAAYSSSLSPKILGNIGYCALKLERDGEAIAAYTRYLQEVQDIDPAEAAQIQRDVATLRAGLVRVVVAVDAPGATVLDKRLPVRGDNVSNLYGPVTGKIDIGLRPGHHIIEVKANGVTLEPWEFDAKPGAALSRTFAVKPAEPEHKSPPPVIPWVVTGVGGATLLAGGIFGAITLSKSNSISSHCNLPNNGCPSSYNLSSAQEDTRRFIRITDTLLIGGAVIAATGLGLVVFSGGSESPHPPAGAAKSTTAQSGLTCSPWGCAATVSGAF